MLKIEGHHIGDSWFFVEGQTAHAFFLVCPDTIKPHTLWDIGHATSLDLTNWTYHGIALRYDKSAWDSSLATGSVIYADGLYHMSYCNLTAQTGMATSPDLFQWTKSPMNPISSIDSRFYETNKIGKRQFLHWRDPFLFSMGGGFLQLVCASNPQAPRDAHGTIGIAESTDLKSWNILPPFQVEPFCEEMECPQLYERNGRYYLVFSTLEELISESRRGDIGSSNLNTAYSMVSENLFGPYTRAKNCRILKGSRPLQPYASQIIHFKEKDYCIGTIWNDGPISYLCDPIPVEFTNEGIREIT